MPVASRRELWLWLLHRRRRLEVKGYSMWPALQPGDELLLDLGAYRHAAPRIGDVVMARHPDRDEFILKRVTQIAADGRLCLRGDNVAHSTDSRVWGFFAASAVRGRVTCRFLRAASRPKRRGLRVSERKGAVGNGQIINDACAPGCPDAARDIAPDRNDGARAGAPG